jgi:hypothetical protein
VERTFSWLGHNRRMSKDYERLCASAEAFSVRLRGHDLTDGEASGSCLRLSRQFRNRNSAKFILLEDNAQSQALQRVSEWLTHSA